MAEIIPFPALLPPSPDDYRAEPATILILPILVDRPLAVWDILPPIVSEATARRVRASMRRLLAPVSTDTGDETD